MKETKKRMLEGVWNDHGEMPEEEEKAGEAEMKLKKQEVQRTKKGNCQRRDQLRVQAQTIERGLATLGEKVVALRAQLQETEEARAEDDARKTKLAEMEAALAVLRQKLVHAEENIRLANVGSEELQGQLQGLQVQTLEVRQRMEGCGELCAAAESKLEQHTRLAESQAARESECVAYYSAFNATMCALAGVRSV